MAVLDHYGHHRGMHTLPLMTRTGRATSQAGGCLRISSPKCIPPKGLEFFLLNDPNRTGYVTSWDDLVINVLEPLHARINTLLVFNLFNNCMQSLTCIRIVLELATCCHTKIIRLIAGGDQSEDSTQDTLSSRQRFLM